MAATRWQRAKDLFQAALTRTPEARAGFLDEACGADRELRAEVESLLAAHREAGGFLSDAADGVPAANPPLEGRRLGHYLVLRQAGQGGMGVVYEAEDTRLGRHVALKLLPASLIGSAAARARFDREARAASALNHPHICTIHDFGEYEGQPFLVMEQMKGATLAQALDGRALPLERVLELGTQLADALDAVHGAGVVHRDVKPANVFVTDHGEAKLLDFGVATISAGAGPSASDQVLETIEGTLTSPGSVLGTVTYMSPEQARGEVLDGRSDLFSLGVVLYEMATGRRPFDGKTHAEIFKAILVDTPLSPTSLNAAIPSGLEGVIQKALEKDKSLRYQHASEMRSDLKRLLRDATSGQLPAGSIAAPTGRRSRRTWWIGASAVALVLAAGLWFGREARRAAPQAGAPAESPSIAVLPFANMSAEQDNEYFSDGLSEELLNALAKIPELRVAARTSSFRFKGKTGDIADIGKQLNVGTILEGSVRKAGRHVRITAQLVKVADGFHLWSETYDRELNDIFSVQDDIARAVSSALRPKLLGKNVPPAAASGDPEAYNLYLQGKYFFERRTREDLAKAVSYYEQALKLDPGYARAWSGLSVARRYQANYGYIPRTEGYRRARREVDKALELDPNLAEAHNWLGWMLCLHDRDWPGADAAFKRALELEPGNATVVRGAASLAGTLGRFEESARLSRRSVELDPLSTAAHNNLGLDAWRAGRLDEADAAFRRALELNPAYPVAHMAIARVHLARSNPAAALQEMEQEKEPGWRRYGLALTYHALGRNKEADAVLGEVLEKDKETSAFQIAEIYAFRGETAKAFEWLERAYTQRDGGLADIKGDPLLRSLQGDPRYTAFLKKMNLPV